MILRIWKTNVLEQRASEFEKFARKYSTPTFKKYAGFLGVFHSRSGTNCATISIWVDEHAIQNLESSREYQDLVSKIKNSGFLTGDQITEVYDLKEGHLSEALIKKIN